MELNAEAQKLDASKICVGTIDPLKVRDLFVNMRATSKTCLCTFIWTYGLQSSAHYTDKNLKRIVHLAAHHQKARIRKKNEQRIARILKITKKLTEDCK